MASRTRAVLTLNDVVKKLEEGNQDQRKTTDALNKFIKSIERGRLDAAENAREASRTNRAAGQSYSSSRNGSGGMGGLAAMAGFGGLAAGLGTITAGLGAITAATMGLRGWELKALKSLDSFGGWSKALNQKFINIRAQFFRKLGLDPRLGPAGARIGGAPGQRRLAVPLTAQLTSKMNTWFKGFSGGFYKMLGLDPITGKALPVRGPDGAMKAATGMPRVVSNVKAAITSLLSPLIRVTDAAADLTKGTFGYVFSWFKTLGGAGAGGALKILGKFGSILKPIGFLISIFDGWKAWSGSEEETQLGKLGDGVGAFLGSFFGAPFDFLKAGVSWIIKNAFGAEGAKYDKDGKYIEGSGNWANAVAAKLGNFSFAKSIAGITKGLFLFVGSAVDNIVTFFKDPKKAITTWFNEKIATFTGSDGAGKAAGIIDIFLMPINMAIRAIKGIFTWAGLTPTTPDGKEFSIGTMLTDWVSDFYGWFMDFIPSWEGLSSTIQSKLAGILPDWVKNNISFFNPATAATGDGGGQDNNPNKPGDSLSDAFEESNRKFDLNKDKSMIIDGIKAMQDGSISRTLNPALRGISAMSAMRKADNDMMIARRTAALSEDLMGAPWDGKAHVINILNTDNSSSQIDNSVLNNSSMSTAFRGYQGYPGQGGVFKNGITQWPGDMARGLGG